nr:MAG TPA: hypothetical protein [Caudoviricetes sp.]
MVEKSGGYNIATYVIIFMRGSKYDEIFFKNRSRVG